MVKLSFWMSGDSWVVVCSVWLLVSFFELIEDVESKKDRADFGQRICKG